MAYKTLFPYKGSHPWYNPFLVYCRELAPGTVSLTCDRDQGDDSKHDPHYMCICLFVYYDIDKTDSHMNDHMLGLSQLLNILKGHRKAYACLR